MGKKTHKILKKALFLAIFLILPNFVFGADLSLIPESATYSVGDTFTVKITASGSSPMNATQGLVYFPPTFFSIQSISKTNSVLNFWVMEPSISRSDGTVKFEGVATSPFSGNDKIILNVTVKALKEGVGSVTFKSGQVLANDGEGTDITGNLEKATYTIGPAKAQPKEATTTEEVIPPPRELNPPTISLGKQDGLLAVLGVSEYSRSNVVLTFISSGGSKIFITGITDENGSFALIVPRALRSGSYSVSAVIVLIDNNRTLTSNVITVEVGLYIYWIIFGIFLILLLIILYLLWRRYFVERKNRKNLQKEVHEAEDEMHRSFKNVRNDIYNSLRTDLSNPQASNDALIKLKNDLDTAEDKIDKEIRDIEST